jgi:REP element-mobilizing transposase RayT
LCFWTITIKDWFRLLAPDDNKLIIIESLQWLVTNELIKIYGYVVMPNHIHLIWEQLKMNSKEFPKNSFEKFTAKSLISKMQKEDNVALTGFAVIASDRKYNVWQCDSLALPILNHEMANQKLDYIHSNPLQAHWGLCLQPEDYRFSSATFYATAKDEFNLVTHIMEAL